MKYKHNYISFMFYILKYLEKKQNIHLQYIMANIEITISYHILYFIYRDFIYRHYI